MLKKHLNEVAPTCFGPQLQPSSGGLWAVLYAVMYERTSTEFNLVSA